MKKTSFLPLLTLLALTACSGNSSDKSGNEADSTQIDTTLTEKADSDEQTATESQQEATSPDLATNDLKGRVKKMVQYYDESDRTFSWTITYTEDGVWATTNGVSLKKYFNQGVKRDAKGRITELNRSVDDSCEMENDAYNYDEQGRVTKEENNNEASAATYKYSYNAEGDRVSAKVVKSDMDEGDSSYTITYKIIERDSHGNWTRRQVSENGVKYTTLRVITYWD